MSLIEAHPAAPQANEAVPAAIVNDFAIVAATVNGSGSQTANNTLIRAMFKMGIQPVVTLFRLVREHK